MKILCSILITCFFFLSTGTLSGQGCYEENLQGAQEDRFNKKYRDAIDKYEYARTCENKPNDFAREVYGLIEETYYEWLLALKTAEEIARANKVEAENAREYAENQAEAARESREVAIAARDEAVKARERERINAKKFEATSLAFSANSERENGDLKAALELAYEAHAIYDELPGEEASNSAIKNAFGDVVVAGAAVDKVKLSDNKTPIAFPLQLERSRNRDGFLVESNAGFTQGGFLPASNSFFLTSRDSNVYLFAMEEGLLKSLDRHEDLITSVEVSAQGNYLLTISRDGTAVLWDRSGKFIRQLKSKKESINTAVFSPDETVIFTGTRSGNILRWEVSTGESNLISGLHKGSIAGFDPTEKYVLTHSYQKVALLKWDGTLAGEIDHKGAIIYSALLFPSKQQVITASSDGTAKVWNYFGKNNLVRSFPHSDMLTYADFSKEGDRIITCGKDVAVVWDIQGKKIHNLSGGHEGMVHRAVFSEDERFVFTTGDDFKIYRWDLDQGEKKLMNQHGGAVNTLLTVPNHDFTCSAADGDRTVRMWDNTSNLLFTRQFTGSPQVTVSDDGNYILMFATDGKAIWCPNPQLVLQELRSGVRTIAPASQEIRQKYDIDVN